MVRQCVCSLHICDTVLCDTVLYPSPCLDPDSLSQQLAVLSQSGDSLSVFVQQYLDLSHVASVRVINHSLILLQGEIGRVKARLRLVRYVVYQINTLQTGLPQYCLQVNTAVSESSKLFKF